MKLQCSTATLRDAVQLLQPVCPLRTTLPILANILVRAEDGRLALTGTDLDISIKTHMPAEVSKEGETTIPVRFLLDALRRIDAESIELTVDAQHVAKIRAGAKVECSLRGMPPGEFPKFPSVQSQDAVELSAKDLHAMFKCTAYAVSKDETRYVLNGVCLHFGEKFDVVATDGRRLAKCTNASIKRDTAREIIVPTKSIGLIQALLNVEGTAQIKYSQSQLEVNVGQTTLVTRLVDGHYPNYEQVIPKNCKYAVELNARAFLNAVNLASVVTEKTKQAVIRVALKDNQLTISANTAEIGEVTDVLEVNYRGETLDIAFNPSYLTDVCQTIDSDQLVLEVTSGSSPAILRSGEQFLCVIMPMRI